MAQQGNFTNAVQINPPMRCVLRGKTNVNIALIGNTEGHSLSGVGVDENGRIQNLSLSEEQSDVVVTDPLYRPISLEQENQQRQQAQQGQRATQSR